MMMSVQLLFQSTVGPLTAFFLLPPILCLVLVGLCSWGKALFPSGGAPLGKGWTRRSCWLQQVAGCLGRGPDCSTCQAGSREGSSHSVCASLPVVEWMGASAEPSTQTFPGHWPTWKPRTPRPPGTCPISKGGFLIVTQWC